MKEYKHSNFVLGKAEEFAVRIVGLYKYLQDKGERVMSKQVLRSGTSIGANLSEGHYAASKADFVNKYVIAQKEAAETLYWIRLLVRTGYLADDAATQSLIADCDEILRLLVASVKTATNKRQNTSAIPNSSFKLQT